MDSHTLVKEIKRLFLENKKRFIRFALLFMLVLFAVQLVPNVIRYLQGPADEEKAPIDFSTKGNPAVFEMYIEYENGSVYTNTLLLEEALKSDQNIQTLEELTGVGVNDLLILEDEVNYPKTARDRGALGATRDAASNIWVIIARVGTEEQNLLAVEYLRDQIANNEVALLNNKPTYIMSNPRVLTDEELANPNTLVDVEMSVNPFSFRTIAATLVVAVAGGCILAFVLVLSYTFINKKISYAFNYNWNEEEVFVLLDRGSQKMVERAVLLPKTKNRILLVQEAGKLSTWHALDNLQVTDNILDSELVSELDEVVIFIQPGITEKAWYNQQRELLKVYRAPVKIIQLNSTQA